MNDKKIDLNAFTGLHEADEKIAISSEEVLNLEKNLFAHRYSQQSLTSTDEQQDLTGLELQAQAYFEAKNKVKTPLFLTNIVHHHFNAQLKAADSVPTSYIQIKIKSALQLLNQTAASLFTIGHNETAMAMRSNAAVADSVGKYDVLNFFQTTSKVGRQGKEEKILYQVVKDGVDTVMLTIRLQNFSVLPKMLYLKRDERLIQSFALKEDYAFFQQLQPGLYTIELRGMQNDIIKKISLQLIAE